MPDRSKHNSAKGAIGPPVAQIWGTDFSMNVVKRLLQHFVQSHWWNLVSSSRLCSLVQVAVVSHRKKRDTFLGGLHSLPLKMCDGELLCSDGEDDFNAFFPSRHAHFFRIAGTKILHSSF